MGCGYPTPMGGGLYCKTYRATLTPPSPTWGGEYNYWDHLDFVVEQAKERGIYVALLPIWGDKFYLDAWGIGPVIFNPENARIYGRWIAERYKDRDNIIWVMGGDRVLLTRQHHGVIHQMALGIREVVGQSQLISFHPTGASSSSRHLHEEDWLDFNMIQSGHRAAQAHNDFFVEHDYNLLPTKPTLEAEPRYEDHPIDFDGSHGYFDSADVRLAAYRAVFAGSLGVTYGHHSVWSFWRDEYEWPGRQAYVIMNWRKALDRPGANQMCHLRSLMESRPMAGRVPDQSLLVEDYPGANHMRAIRGHGHVFVYSPCGIPFGVRLGVLPGTTLKATWFDPRTGETHPQGEINNQGQARFAPPSSGRGDDWVLVLDGE
ncbi:MAG: hypothetical protein C4342_07685 [Armatimonadota bacterium]